MKQTVLAAIALSLLLGAAACRGDSDPPAAEQGSADPEVTATPLRCDGQEEAVAEGEQQGGELVADVDGDGSDDDVRLVLDRAGPAGCMSYLVVETEEGQVVTPTNEEGLQYSLQSPRLNSAVPIDGEPGVEILVDLEQGAASQFVGMFTLRDGELHRVEVRDDPLYSDLFPYGGSVGHIEASNCGDPAGIVVIAAANPAEAGYRVQRRVFEMDGIELIPVAQQPKDEVVRPSKVTSLEDFRTSPFGACGT